MLELKREEIQLLEVKELHSHLSKRLRRHSCNRKKMLFIHHSSGRRQLLSIQLSLPYEGP